MANSPFYVPVPGSVAVGGPECSVLLLMIGIGRHSSAITTKCRIEELNQ